MMESLKSLLPTLEEKSGRLEAKIEMKDFLQVAQSLRDDFSFTMLSDITAVDEVKVSQEFELVYYFYSLAMKTRLHLKFRLSEGGPKAPTMIKLFDSAKYLEREVHEMFGIVFEGNPDLRPILLYKGFQGHPLRKDYAIDKMPSLEVSEDAVESNIRPSADGEHLVMNFGPSHPATHGTIQIVLKIQGETIEEADVHCGFLHRGFEKECERHHWHNVIPFTDRLNYCSPLINNVAYAEAVEKLCGLEITPRVTYMRTLLSEYSRLTDHLTCIAANLMELGAMTPFLYLMTIRDYMYEHQAALTGARLTHSFVRFGGMEKDFPTGWLERMEELLKFYEDYIQRVHKLIDRNRIFIDRMRNTGLLSKKDALSYGVTGPLLRASGVSFDLRKDHPYLAYADLEFDIPVGINGDNYDRYYVRMREMDESVYLIRQCMERMPEGPLNTDKTHRLPKIPTVPAGEIYTAHEGANGELGFFIVSKGGRIPHRIHVRSPSFLHTGALGKLIVGDQLADIIASFGMINMIGGECDR